MNRTGVLQTIAEVGECIRVDLNRTYTELEDCEVERLSTLIQTCYFVYFPGEPTLPRSLIYHDFVSLMFMSAHSFVVPMMMDCDDLLVLDQVLMESSTRFKQRVSMVSRVFHVLGHAFSLYPHVHMKFYQQVVGDKLIPYIVKGLTRAIATQPPDKTLAPYGLLEHLRCLKRIDGKRWKQVEYMIIQSMREWVLVHRLCEDHLPSELMRLVWLGF